MSTKRRLSVNSGISLFLILLIIMCLVSFASLSLSSALADMRLSEKYAQQAEWYYEAHNAAQRDLAKMNAAGSAAAADVGGNGKITKHYPAGDVLQLTVIFEPVEASDTSPSARQSGTETGSTVPPAYRIVSEKLESVEYHELDESLHVMLSGN